MYKAAYIFRLLKCVLKLRILCKLCKMLLLYLLFFTRTQNKLLSWNVKNKICLPLYHLQPILLFFLCEELLSSVNRRRCTVSTSEAICQGGSLETNHPEVDETRKSLHAASVGVEMFRQFPHRKRNFKLLRSWQSEFSKARTPKLTGTCYKWHIHPTTQGPTPPHFQESPLKLLRGHEVHTEARDLM